MGDAAVKEPTMEDILSSIRKIIAEDGDDAALPAVQADAEPSEPAQGSAQIESQVSPEQEDFAEPMVAAEPEPVPEVLVEEPPQAIAPEMPEPVTEPEMAQEVEPAAGSLAQVAAQMQAVEQNQPDDYEHEPEPVAQAESPVEEPQMAQAEQSTSPAEPEAETSVVVSKSLAEIAAAAKAMEAAELPGSMAGLEAAQVDEPAPMMEAVAEEIEPEITHVEMAQAMLAPVSEQADEAAGGYAEDVQEGAFKGALMSPGSNGAVAGSFDRLKRSAMDDIEAKTEAVLRPMLREWLDENLPNLVERLVREEIERVARG